MVQMCFKEALLDIIAFQWHENNACCFLLFQIFHYFFDFFFRIFRAAHLNFPSFFAGARGAGPGPGPGPAKKDGKCFFFFSTGFSSRMGPKKQFFDYFLAVFPYIWPLARPNIAEKGWPLLGKAKLSSRDQVGC